MINLKGLTQKQKVAVLSVFDFAKKHKYDTDKLEVFLKEKGWKKYYGSFKECYKKYGLVIKFSSMSFGKKECAREYEQWLAMPRSFRKHFARTIAYKNNILVQEAVEECSAAWDCKAHKNILEKYWEKLADTAHNHGHKNGKLKFFDWVYYRIPKYINTNKWLPGSKRRVV